MGGKLEIENIIQRIAMSAIKRFYPTYISKQVSLSLEETSDYLMELYKENKVKVIWEVRCPNCYSNIIELENDEKEGLNEDEIIECITCGEEVELVKDIIFPAFEINPDHREAIKNQIKH